MKAQNFDVNIEGKTVTVALKGFWAHAEKTACADGIMEIDNLEVGWMLGVCLKTHGKRAWEMFGEAFPYNAENVERVIGAIQEALPRHNAILRS